MHVTERRARGHPFARIARGRAREHAFDVERKRRHLQLALGTRPVLARPVAVDLDAVALGIVEIERLRHEMVGRAGEPMPARRDPVQRAGELGAVGDEEREMEEARGSTGARRRIGALDERHERAVVVGRPELGNAVGAAELAQPDRVAIEAGLRVEVADSELDVGERRGGIDAS